MRSMQKDFCPGYLGLAVGGIVGYADTDVDSSAKRELEEELGIKDTNPEYLYKYPIQDDSVNAWNYVYFHLLHDGIELKP